MRVTFDARNSPSIQRLLVRLPEFKPTLDHFVQEAPSPAHRMALEASALLRLTTESILAEMPPEEKDRISHRGRALREIAPVVAAHLGG